MDSIAEAGAKIKWSDETSSVNKIEEKFGFPQIVKACAKTSFDYKLSDDEIVLLLSKRNPVRLIAQTIEEGDYVMGKQIEIPSEYNGLFKISNEFEREYLPLMNFRSIQEVADASPSKIYLQKQLTVIFPDEETPGKGPVTLQKGDELTIVNKLESNSHQGLAAKPTTSRLFNRVLRAQHSYLMVYCVRLNECLRLPYSTQGWFATRPPAIVFLSEKRGVISLQQIMEKANFPISAAVTTNSSRSVKDEFLLRSGMNLKLIGLEEHDIVLGVTPTEQIVEFSAKDVTFKLPSVLASSSPTENSVEQTAELNQYQTFLQQFYMDSKLQCSPTNIEEYCTSVRFHIPRNVRPTNPVPLNCNASLRALVLSPGNQRRRMNIGESTRGLSSIQRLNNSQKEDGMLNLYQNSKRENLIGSKLPNFDFPPLPPRNSLPSINVPATTHFRNDYPPNFHAAPPVPPKSQAPFTSFTVPYPQRGNLSPPALPPARLSSVRNQANLPVRQSPAFSKPAVDSFPNGGITHLIEDNLNDGEESIWEEFRPKSKVLHESNDRRDALNGVAKSDIPLATQRTIDEAAVGSYPDTAADDTPPAAIAKDFTRDLYSFPSSSPQEDSRMSNGDAASTSFRHETPVDPEESWEFEQIYTNAEDVAASALSKQAQTSSTLTEVGAEIADDNAAESATNCTSENNEATFIDSNSLPLTSQLGSGTNRQSRSGTRPHTADDPETTQSDRVPVKSYASLRSGWHPGDDVLSLTVNETTASLRYIGLSEDVVKMFSNERIDGTMLTELSDAILEEDFHLSKLHRLKIKRFIQGWRPKLPESKCTSFV